MVINTSMQRIISRVPKPKNWTARVKKALRGVFYPARVNNNRRKEVSEVRNYSPLAEVILPPARATLGASRCSYGSDSGEASIDYFEYHIIALQELNASASAFSNNQLTSGNDVATSPPWDPIPFSLGGRLTFPHFRESSSKNRPRSCSRKRLRRWDLNCLPNIAELSESFHRDDASFETASSIKHHDTSTNF